jgi:hypothetical protein
MIETLWDTLALCCFVHDIAFGLVEEIHDLPQWIEYGPLY